MTLKLGVVIWVTMFLLTFAGVAPFEKPPRSLIIPAGIATTGLAMILLWVWAVA
jgi:hypothetical protein